MSEPIQSESSPSLKTPQIFNMMSEIVQSMLKVTTIPITNANALNLKH